MLSTAAKIFACTGTLIFAVCSAVILTAGQEASGLNNFFPLGLTLLAARLLITAGAGAFASVFLYRIFRVDSLKAAAAPAAAVSLASCLISALLLLLNSGQPARIWYAAAYPNWGTGLMPVSGLTAALFSLMLFILLLCTELAIIYKTRASGGFAVRCAKKLLWAVTAASGFFAFFVQGSFASAPMHNSSPLFFFQGVFASAAAGLLFLSLIKGLTECRQALLKAGGISLLLYFALRLAFLLLEIILCPVHEYALAATAGCAELVLGVMSCIMLLKRKEHGALWGLVFIAAGRLSMPIHEAFRLRCIPSLWEIGIFTGAFAAAFLLYRLIAGVLKRGGIFQDMPPRYY